MASPMKWSVTVCIGELSLSALGGEGARGPETVSASLARAARLYLRDRDTGQPGWAYPAMLREKAPGEVEVELDIEEALWRAFQEEAIAQGVSVSQLAAHAALYYAAELDSGRITQRILDGIEGDDVETERT